MMIGSIAAEAETRFTDVLRRLKADAERAA